MSNDPPFNSIFVLSFLYYIIYKIYILDIKQYLYNFEHINMTLACCKMTSTSNINNYVACHFRRFDTVIPFDWQIV